MKLLEKIKSNKDKTIKYVFQLNDGILTEATYIDNNTGKDIICISSQTMCAMGCTFCHLTDYIGKLKLRNLNRWEITEPVDYIYDDLKLKDNNRTLFISYMGVGEPLLNVENVIESMILLKTHYTNIRFGLATSLPKGQWKNIFTLANDVKYHEIPLKVHLSLHYTNNEQRNKMMPNATNIKASIAALEFYKEITGNPVEIHYTLIKDMNDSRQDIAWLIYFLEKRDIPVKFLRFNSKESNEQEGAELKQIEVFRNALEERNITTEYYEPPGKDVGASCGQFLFDKYKKHSLVEENK